MCLQLPHSDKPHNRSNVRWKVLVVRNGKLVSPYKDVKWNVGSFKRARVLHQHDVGSITRNHPNFGIHVFLTKTDAVAFAEQIGQCDRAVVVKLIVSRFNKAGYYPICSLVSGEGIWVKVKNETWKTAQLIEVFDASGKNKITERYLYS
jgi:hypothetical protein